MAFSKIKKLFRGLTRTREALADTLQFISGAEKVDEEELEDLEAGLLAADLGPTLTGEVMKTVRQRAARESLDVEGLREVLKEVLGGFLAEDGPEGNGGGPRVPATPPRVVFVVGVNGGGKTTTVGKLAAMARARGNSAMVVAADTFRAAAIDQLERWAERSGTEVVKHREGADPSSVVFDALQSATSRKIDEVFVDTAGRLHTKTNLMSELGKLSRVSAKVVEGSPHEVLLVVDATTGQNGLNQAEEFTKAAQLTGVVLTKLDGTAKGGVALGIRRHLGVPIRYVGVGEGIDDLLDFDPGSFLNGLLGEGEREIR
jgi:fused signal recognition particle receptor